MSKFYKFENRYIIKAKLSAKTAISIGKGISLIPSGSDLPVIKTPDGIPFIPGSSLKGVIRSFIEKTLRAFQEINKSNQINIKVCDPLDNERCCVSVEKKQQLAEKYKGNERELAKQIYSESCAVCRLFGSRWLASRVYVKDAFLKNLNKMIHLVEFRDGVAIDRDLGTAKPKMKFDFECVPAGGIFELEIIVENGEQWEVGLVLLALKAIDSNLVSIGGKVSRGLGWCGISDIQIQKITPSDLLNYIQNGVAQVVDPNACVESLNKALSGGGEYA